MIDSGHSNPPPSQDVHTPALERSRKRAALAAWQECVALWHAEGQPPPTGRFRTAPEKNALRRFANALRRAGMGLDVVAGPAGTAKGW